jgi:hypothetical protein
LQLGVALALWELGDRSVGPRLAELVGSGGARGLTRANGRS